MNVVLQFKGQAVLLEEEDLQHLLWMRDEFIPRRDDVGPLTRAVMLREVSMFVSLLTWDGCGASYSFTTDEGERL